MAGKQIDFPPLQKEDKRVAPFMIGVSVIFALIVVVILLTDLDGPVHRAVGLTPGASEVEAVSHAALPPLRDLQPEAGARPALERELGHDAASLGLERRPSGRPRRARVHLPRLLREAPGLAAPGAGGPRARAR